MRDATRAALLQLAAQLPDTRGMFGADGEVPETETLYLNLVWLKKS